MWKIFFFIFATCELLISADSHTSPKQSKSARFTLVHSMQYAQSALIHWYYEDQLSLKIQFKDRAPLQPVSILGDQPWLKFLDVNFVMSVIK